MANPTPASLLHGDSAFFMEKCVPMYKAAMKGDWRAASNIVDGCNDILRSAITLTLDTPLHVASSMNRVAFVRKLLERLQNNDLALQNMYGLTAITVAAQYGATEIVQMILAVNPTLGFIPENQEQFPLLAAITFGHKKLVSVLFETTDFPSISDQTLAKLFHNLIYSNFFDFAVRLLRERDTLALARDSNNYTALHLMAMKPNAISPNRLFTSFFHGGTLWNQFLRNPDYERLVSEPTNLILEAATVGNAEFLAIGLSMFPDIIWFVDENEQTIFHIAAANRHETVFSLIFELSAAKSRILESIDKSGCNILHLTARLPPNDRLQAVSGAAFQMQRELLWFEAVKKMVTPACIERKSGDQNKTADVIFMEEHQSLRKEGEKWLKGTSTTCMIVATLIATLVFSASINVPGGFDNNGYPVLVNNIWFQIFYAGAAVAFICSSLSIVLFMSILTSRNSSEEFRTMIPFRLMVGLVMLFVSIVAMVTSFCGVVIIMHHSKISWKLATVVGLVLFTGISFIALHLNLFSGMLRAAYWSKFSFRPRRRFFL